MAAAVLAPPAAFADSSTPRLAAYYERQLAICDGNAYAWTGRAAPALAVRGAVAVGVGREDAYALTGDGRLLTWRDDPAAAQVVLAEVASFAAGDSGVLAIRNDGSLWHAERARGKFTTARVADRARAASVGDGTDYYVAGDGRLFARGNGHRGQFGNGGTGRSDAWIEIAASVREVRSHTGHALLLGEGGEVQGTGGNIYGPLGRHGLGDRALAWGPVFGGASGIATGASHSVALQADGTLWIWGRNESPDPRRVLDNVAGAAAGSDVTIALTRDGGLWQWRNGAPPSRVRDCG
ncbi:MAG: hypothetical protein U1F54_09590 [Burkholderiales bacterium]